MPDPSLLEHLLDRAEITAVMAAYARWADLNQPEQPGGPPPAAAGPRLRRADLTAGESFML